MKTNKQTYVQPQARVYNIQQNLMDGQASGGDQQGGSNWGGYAKESNLLHFLGEDEE